jgi:hypothetical protein
MMRFRMTELMGARTPPLASFIRFMVGVVNVGLVWMFELETEPAVLGMAFNTELTKNDSTVTRLPAEAPVARTTVVPLEAV